MFKKIQMSADDLDVGPSEARKTRIKIKAEFAILNDEIGSGRRAAGYLQYLVTNYWKLGAWWRLFAAGLRLRWDRVFLRKFLQQYPVYRYRIVLKPDTKMIIGDGTTCEKKIPRVYEFDTEIGWQTMVKTLPVIGERFPYTDGGAYPVEQMDCWQLREPIHIGTPWRLGGLLYSCEKDGGWVASGITNYDDWRISFPDKP